MTSSIDTEILTEALRQAPSVIVITDADMSIVYVNRVQSGFALEDVLGRRQGYSLPPEQQRKLESLFERARTTGRPQQYETFHDAPDGQRRWYSSQITSYATSDGVLHGMISILTDVTLQHDAEVRADDLRRRLIHASHRAGMAEIASGVLDNVSDALHGATRSAEALMQELEGSRRHRLDRAVAMLEGREPPLGERTPGDSELRTLPALLGEIGRELEAERQRLHAELDRMRDRIGLMRSIVAAQQSIAKLGEMVVSARPDELVHQVLAMFRLDLEGRFIDLRLELEDLGSVMLDRQATLQVLVNLVRNAIEALEVVERPRRLELRLRADEQSLRFDVEDDGCGIHQEHRDRLFEHGFSTKVEGHGFGLYTSAIAARTMNGTIEVHSDGPDRGARFTLVLPRIAS